MCHTLFKILNLFYLLFIIFLEVYDIIIERHIHIYYLFYWFVFNTNKVLALFHTHCFISIFIYSLEFNMLS